MKAQNFLPPGIWSAPRGGLWGKAVSSQPGKLRPKLHGSVQHVLSGLAHQQAAFVNPASFRFAIGCGTVTGAVDQQGELIITAALKSAPIEGQPIDQSYWADPVEVENQTAIVCGMAASGRGIDHHVFYQNPADPPGRRELLTHTHVLRYAGGPAAQILAANTEGGLVVQLPDQPPQIDVGHLLSQSVVNRASLAVF